MIRRALISVSDKTGVTEFAQTLHKANVEIISTGGTAKAIEEAGIPVLGISDVTDFPEMLEGRVKTLHPNVHAGLLAKDTDDHMTQLREHDIAPIDLVVVNLYPFKSTIAKPDVTREDAIENIDIGGPAMLRASAKNHDRVTVIVDPADYGHVVDALNASAEVPLETRQALAAKVFRHTAHYDAMIADYLTEEKFPEVKTVTYERVDTLRYGENPHQDAAFYKQPLATGSLAEAKQLHGKALSYNNIQDAEAALAIVKEFNQPAAVAVKHTNPCGVGFGDSIAEAFNLAYEADPKSIFGGIVALNREVDAQTAEQLHGIFLEIVIAPRFSQEAIDQLTQKKNIRLLELPIEATDQTLALTSIHGGLLLQDEDTAGWDDATIEVATERQPTDVEWANLKFAWQVVKHVKSNAILLAKDQKTIGVGAGQMNRVGAADIAIQQAGDLAQGAVMASDAFFPMSDTVEAAHAAGITAIVQPGGSKRDQDSIDFCNANGITMVFTGMRHFKH